MKDAMRKNVRESVKAFLQAQIDFLQADRERRERKLESSEKCNQATAKLNGSWLACSLAIRQAGFDNITEAEFRGIRHALSLFTALGIVDPELIPT